MLTVTQSYSHREGNRRGVTQEQVLCFSSTNINISPVEALEWIKLSEQRNIYQVLPVKFTSMQMIDKFW